MKIILFEKNADRIFSLASLRDALQNAVEKLLADGFDPNHIYTNITRVELLHFEEQHDIAEINITVARLSTVND